MIKYLQVPGTWTEYTYRQRALKQGTGYSTTPVYQVPYTYQVPRANQLQKLLILLLSHKTFLPFYLERGLSIAKSIAGKKKKRQWPAIWQSAGKYPLWEPCGGRVQFSARMAQVPCLCLCLAHLINQSMDRDLIRTDQATNI